MIIVLFTGCHHPTVKEEPKSLTQPANKNHKAYFTTDPSSVGCIETMGFDFDPTQQSGKHHKSASGGPSQV
jgi:hypothetical protein